MRVRHNPQWDYNYIVEWRYLIHLCSCPKFNGNLYPLPVDEYKFPSMKFSPEERLKSWSRIGSQFKLRPARKTVVVVVVVGVSCVHSLKDL